MKSKSPTPTQRVHQRKQAAPIASAQANHKNQLAPLLRKAIVAATITLATALASAIPLPSFTDLSTKWGLLKLGMSPEIVTALLDATPTAKYELVALGVNHKTLNWIDIKFTRYEAKFIADRLYFKSTLTP
jgi:hypothetical protein